MSKSDYVDVEGSPRPVPPVPPVAPVAPVRLADEYRAALKRVAAGSVRYGLASRAPSPVDVSMLAPPLRELRATFVTLKLDGALRGCIGSLTAKRALAADVAENAFAAAFRDARFAPVTAVEFARLEYHISILHPPIEMTVESEAALVSQLRVGVDGLIIEEPPRRATFLPDVWQTLPDPQQFVAHLKRKGGWEEGEWSAKIKVARYTTEGF